MYVHARPAAIFTPISLSIERELVEMENVPLLFLATPVVGFIFSRTKMPVRPSARRTRRAGNVFQLVGDKAAARRRWKKAELRGLFLKILNTWSNDFN